MKEKQMWGLKKDNDKICHKAINSKKWLRLSRRLEREFTISCESQLQKQAAKLAASSDYKMEKHGGDLKYDAAKEPPKVASTNDPVYDKAQGTVVPTSNDNKSSFTSLTCSLTYDANRPFEQRPDLPQESAKLAALSDYKMEKHGYDLKYDAAKEPPKVASTNDPVDDKAQGTRHRCPNQQRQQK
eukprot:scaffold1555_cov66-Cyclotella_meneghiniana.AAC.1